MNRKHNAVVAICAAAFSCAGLRAESAHSSVETLQARGLSAAAISVESEASLTFVNADRSPHQIYSPDCRELASAPLRPGERYTAVLGLGPKLCHFQDLLAPLEAAYWGTVEVRDDFLFGE